jgi:hypothetical protein
MLIVVLAACLTDAVAAGNLPLAVVSGLLVVPLCVRNVREFRRLPPAGRRHLLRLVWARWAQAGHRVIAAAMRGRAALARGRAISSSAQAGNEAAGS